VPRRIATQSLSLECYLITTVGLKHHVKRSGIYSFEHGVSTNILGSSVFWRLYSVYALCRLASRWKQPADSPSKTVQMGC